MSKSRIIGAGCAGSTIYNCNVNLNTAGGTKKQVTTVAKTDLDSLKKSVEAEVKKKAEEELSKSVAKDEFMIDDMTSIEVTDTEYSGEVGEEAKEIKITASSEIEYYTLQKEQIIKELYAKLEKEKKQSYVVDTSALTYKILDIAENDDGESVDMTIQVTTKQYEKLDDTKLKKSVTMKSASNVDSILKAAYDIQAASVKKATPAFPWLPLFIKNITIETATK